MPLCLDVCLMGERYDAGGGDDPRSSEWPPHPARAFSALRSVAEPHELNVLRRLEQLPPPTIHAARSANASRRSSYVVTNAREAKGGHQIYPGRTNGRMARVSAFPADPRVRYVWFPEQPVSPDVVKQLDELARRVPYLGRSSSPAIMAFRSVETVALLPELDALEPTSHDQADLYLRAPYPGYVDELNALHDMNQPAWQASSTARQPYRWATGEEAPAPPATARSPYEDLVILRFTDVRPEGALVGRFTAALRSKVMSQTENPLPPALHGHGIDGQPHVAYLGLPFVGAEHADGRLLGLAVAIPGMSVDERRRILRGLLGPDPELLVDLGVPSLGSFTLRHAPHDPLPHGATAERWTKPARTWVSATPLVLDRYPKKKHELSDVVAQTIANSGLPTPASVQVSKQPLTPGGVRLAPQQLPKRARGRLYCHARVTFDRPVAGPVLAGAGRYFGVGLFAPEPGGVRDDRL